MEPIAALIALADFFGTPSLDEALLVEIVGAPQSALAAIATGGQPEGVDYAHLEHLAAFVNETRLYLFEAKRWTHRDQADMRSWLDSGQIDLAGGRRTPRDILIDPKLTALALSDLLRVTE